MSEYHVQSKTVSGEILADQTVEEQLGEVSIPDDAIAVNTTATTSTPPIVMVTWLESINND